MSVFAHVHPKDLISYHCSATQEWQEAIVIYTESWGVLAIDRTLPFKLRWHEIFPPF